ARRGTVRRPAQDAAPVVAAPRRARLHRRAAAGGRAPGPAGRRPEGRRAAGRVGPAAPGWQARPRPPPPSRGGPPPCTTV
ncbi:MAG: hypothetical protein AVDCRST_MAG66-1860, partial [uncultured Pseudonocardia sp.]